MICSRFSSNSLLLLLFATLACNFTKDTKPQFELHSSLHDYYQRAFNDTAKEVRESADTLSACMNLRKTCLKSKGIENNLLSSTFVPSFSKRGLPLSKFLSASQALETRWDPFLKSHTFISWIYAFDDMSGALRISPATATDMTYGKKMDFRQFEFYQSAKNKMSQVVWQDKPKEDVSGTGSILIASTARKTGNGIQVISADIKVTSLARSSYSTLNQLVTQRRTKSLLFFAYQKSENELRSLLAEYATDQSQWLSMRSFPSQTNNFLRVLPGEQIRTLEIEKLVESKPESFIHIENIMLAENSYSCSVSQVKEPTVILWLCIQ